MTGPFQGSGGGRTVPKHIASRGFGEAPEPPPELKSTLSIPPWDQHKPPTAMDFYSFTSASLVLPNGVGQKVATTQATGGFMALGADNIGVLQTVIFTIDAPTTAMNFRFSVLQNGSGIPGLSAVGFPPINGSTFIFPLKSTWQLQAGAVLTVEFVNLAATGPWTLGVVLSGYQVSAADVYQYTGQRMGTIETGSDKARSQRFLTR